MNATLDLSTISGNLFDYWELHFSPDVATAYPGVPIDTHEQPAWIDIELPTITPRVVRDSSPHQYDILWQIHIFARRSTDQTRLDGLAQGAFDILSGITIPLYSTDSSCELLGYAQIREGELHNRSRPDSEHYGNDLQRGTMAFRGLIQELPDE